MGGTTFMSLVLALLVVLLLILWLKQFVMLMLLEDNLFPGRYDKIIWAAAFILLFWITPFAFMVWRGAYTQMREQN